MENKRQKEKIAKCLLVKGARQAGKSYIIKTLEKMNMSLLSILIFFDSQN